MTRKMADSIYSAQIPVGVFPLVAGYINGPRSRWSQADWDRHAGYSTLIRITVSAFVNDGHVLDVEKDDATPAQAPPWVRMRRATGADPTVYCSEAAWPAVRTEFANQGVLQPHYWVAAYPGEGAQVVPSGAVAHQWIDRGPYDESIVADYWPGVDPGGIVSLNQDDANGLSTTTWSVVINKTDPLAAYLKTIGYTADANGNMTVSAPFGQMQLYTFLRVSQLANATSGVLAKLDALSTAEAKTDADVLALPAPGQVTDAQMADLEAKLVAAYPNYNVTITKA